MDSPLRVLLVEDDERARVMLAGVLTRNGYRVVDVGLGMRGIEELEQGTFDIVLSDIWMPDITGVEVMNAARSRPEPPEVILMTGNSTIATAVAAMRAGACNYLLKPCPNEEMLSAVSAAGRRRRENMRRAHALRTIASQIADVVGGTPVEEAPPPAASAPASLTLERFLRIGGLEIDRHRHVATFNGQLLHLTPIEFTLLITLAEADGRVVSWTELTSRSHQSRLNALESHELLRVHIRNLRRKIDPSYLVTVRGIGFRLVDPDERS